MPKTYTDELADWTCKRQGKARERNLVTFHGLQDDVRAALEAGFSVKTIWSHMHEKGRVAFGYETFLGYVSRFVRSGPKTREEAQPTEDSTSANKAADAPVRSTSAADLTHGPRDVSARKTTATATRPAQPHPTPTNRRTGMPTFKFNPLPKRESNT